MKKQLLIAALALTPLLAGCTATSGDTGDADAAADAFPANCQSINLIVGFSAGGATDLAFRTLADQLKAELGVDVQVINAPGGGGSVEINQMLSAPHDGCTLGHSSIPSHLQYLYPEVDAGYTKDDFAFAGAFGIGPQVLAVAADSPYQTLDDLLDSAGSDGLIAVADAPKGGDAIINAQFADAAGITVKQVIVDGSSEKVTAVLSGQVDYENGAIGGLLSSVESGQLRALAVWSSERTDALPDVPTAKELGIDVVVETQYALMMPSDVPEEARQKIEDTLKTITENPDFQSQLADLGIPTVFQTGKQYSKTWDDMAVTVQDIDFDSLN
jgi:tripartite-type tricarboxylate transporter receptor subunit TctC